MELHAAILGLIEKWSERAEQIRKNIAHARSYETALNQERLLNQCNLMLEDLNEAIRLAHISP